jgi:hypothetical protein
MSVLSLAEAKTHLNITGTVSDAELQGFIDAAESVVAERCGPLEPTDVTDRIVARNGRSILLSVAPVISVTSVTASDSSTVNPADLTVTEAGVVSYTDGLTPFGCTTYTVTYQAGRWTLPAALLMAVKEELRHLWKTQRGGSARPGAGADQQQAPGYLVPYMVAELIEPYRMNLGVA